mgnify:CR=1 FL=1
MPTSSRRVTFRYPADVPESELIARAAQGDGTAFEAIMRHHNQLLFRTARSIVHDDTEAEDVVQEAWMRAWRALGKFHADSRLSTWLTRITINEALGRLRRKSAQVVPLEAAMMSTDSDTQAALADDPGRRPEQSVEGEQVRQLVETRIDQLPEAFRTVFMLRAVEELSVAEVAEALEIPEATVRTRFFRARSLLREGLAQQVDAALGDVFSFDGARCDRITATVLARGKAEGLNHEDPI